MTRNNYQNVETIITKIAYRDIYDYDYIIASHEILRSVMEVSGSGY